MFHRVTPDVFENCGNCHRPHLWKPDGNDCAACHGAAGSPAAVRAMARFPHDRHESLACSECHETVDSHSRLVAGTTERCASCHHSPPVSDNCVLCHTRPEISGPRARAVAMRLSAETPPRNRRLVFDHASHAALQCGSCHAAPHDAPPRVDCASCHESHHGANVSCRTCHETPPPGVHPLSVHETGCATAGCHAETRFTGPAGSALTRSVDRSRALCLSCHAGLDTHQPGRDCATCHLMPRFGGGGRP